VSFTNLFKSKTVWGVLIAVFGYLADPGVLAVLPPKVAAIITGLGIILGAVGAREAIAKNGSGA
jgi:hypothetical protein